MTPTLTGRIQTRLLLIATLGALWTLVLAYLLPAGEAKSDDIAVRFGVLFAVFVFGAGWDCIYFLAQQLRWEKDWPTLFGLLTCVNEAALIWVLLQSSLVPWIPAAMRPTFDVFAVHFATVWVLLWLVAHGPIKAALPRWRFRGGALFELQR